VKKCQNVNRYFLMLKNITKIIVFLTLLVKQGHLIMYNIKRMFKTFFRHKEKYLYTICVYVCVCVCVCVCTYIVCVCVFFTKHNFFVVQDINKKNILK